MANPDQPKGLALHWAELAPVGGCSGLPAFLPIGAPIPTFSPGVNQLAVIDSGRHASQFQIANTQRIEDSQINDAALKYLADMGASAPQPTFSELEPSYTHGARTVEDAAQAAALTSARMRSMSFPPELSGPGEPKGRLSQVCQKLVRRPITKDDVIYNVMAVGRGQWMGTVTLMCVSALEFGANLPPSPDRKTAEKNAATAALASIMPHSDFASSTPSAVAPLRMPAPVMPMPSPAAMAAMAAMGGGFGGGPVPVGITNPGMNVSGGGGAMGMSKASMSLPPEAIASALPKAASPMAAAQMPAALFALATMPSFPLGLEPSPGAMMMMASLPDGQNPKQALNEALMRLVKIPLTKDSIQYATMTVPGGHQATVRILCLPGSWAHEVWAGQVTAKRKDAETSAATAALGAIMAIPDFFSILSAPKQMPKAWGPGGKGGIQRQQQRLTSQAPKTGLRIALEDDKEGARVWTVDISPATTMSSVRALIATSRIPAPAEYLFAVEGMPVAKDTEAVIYARDFLPCVTLMNEDIKRTRRKRDEGTTDRDREREREKQRRR